MPKCIVRSTKQTIKHITLLLLLFTLLLTPSIANPALIYSQSPYDTAKENYSIQLKKYNTAKNNYEIKKASYETFQTATSKKEAFDSTKKYLSETSFLLAEKIRIIIEFGNLLDWRHTTYKPDTTLNTLEEELDYLQEYWNRVQETTSLEQLPPFATELDIRLTTSLIPKTDIAKGTYEIVKTETTHTNYKNLTQTIKDFVRSRVTEENQSIVDNWDTEIDNIDRLTKQSIDKAKFQLQKINPSRKSSAIKGVFNNTKDAKNELKKSIDLFEEILRII